MRTPRNTEGAHAVRDEPPKRRGGLLWLLLGLLALVVVAAILIAALSRGDDEKDKGTTGAPNTEQQSQAGAGPSAGRLTAGATSLLPVDQAGDLAGSVGQTAEGRAVVVQSVVPRQGFWVGTSKDDRLYVEYGGNVGENEPGTQPKVGIKVDLTGPVRKAPPDPEKTLNLSGQDAAQVAEQGVYINAKAIKPA